MTRTGRTLTEYLNMGAAGKLALISFIRYLPPDSALYRAEHPKDEFGPWYTTEKTNMILADLFDLILKANSRKGQNIKPYPRPRKVQGIGKGAIPLSKFWSWWKGEK